MPYRFRVLALVSSLIVLMYLDRLAIAVAGPRMQADLGLSSTDWGWIIGAFTLGYALFEVPTGLLADRLGPRRVIARIVVWWSIFTFATGMVSGLGILLLVRFLFGAGEAGAFPSTASVISRWVPAKERGIANSVVWTSSSVGGLLTPLLVVPIQQAYGWRASFLVLGAIGLAWAVFWYASFRDSPDEVAHVSQAEREKIGKHIAVRHGEHVSWRRLLRTPNFLRVLAMYHTYCWGAYFYLSWLPTYLQNGRGLSEDSMKFASSATFAAGLVGVVVGGVASDALVRRFGLRVGRGIPAATGLIVSGAMLAMTAYTDSAAYAVTGLCLGLAAMNLMLPISWALCLDIGGKHVGAVSGAMNMAGQAGSFISSIGFGYFVKWWGSYDSALLPLAAMLVVSGIIYLTIDPATPLFREDNPEAVGASAV
jgi:MFS transporter, ACS family, glucarate transporter